MNRSRVRRWLAVGVACITGLSAAPSGVTAATIETKDRANEFEIFSAAVEGEPVSPGVKCRWGMDSGALVLWNPDLGDANGVQRNLQFSCKISKATPTKLEVQIRDAGDKVLGVARRDFVVYPAYISAPLPAGWKRSGGEKVFKLTRKTVEEKTKQGKRTIGGTVKVECAAGGIVPTDSIKKYLADGADLWYWPPKPVIDKKELMGFQGLCQTTVKPGLSYGNAASRSDFRITYRHYFACWLTKGAASLRIWVSVIGTGEQRRRAVGPGIPDEIYYDDTGWLKANGARVMKEAMEIVDGLTMQYCTEGEIPNLNGPQQETNPIVDADPQGPNNSGSGDTGGPGGTGGLDGGLISEPNPPVPPDTDAWVLVDVVDHPPAVEKIGNYRQTYKRGDVSGKISAEGGIVFECRLRWSDPPSRILPNQVVSIPFSYDVVSENMNVIASYTHDASVMAPGMKPGYGSALRTFKDEKGVGSLNLGTTSSGGSRTVSGILAGKGKPGQKLAIYVHFRAGTGQTTMQTEYVYEWKGSGGQGGLSGNPGGNPEDTTPKPPISDPKPPKVNNPNPNPPGGDTEVKTPKPPTPDPKSPGSDPKDNDYVPDPPKGEPADVTQMTLQAGVRKVAAGQSVTVPVWLIQAAAANMNFNVGYDSAVVAPEGAVAKGNLLDKSLFEANTAEKGLVRIGFAQGKDLSGVGTVAQIPFKAVGKPGDRSALRLEVVKAGTAGAAGATVAVIHGEVLIVGEDGEVPGDGDGDGVVTAGDSLSALKMSVKLIPAKPNMDVDKDGRVTSNDAMLILQKVVGK